ncbi:MAG TPA: D-2-hydroxyacid dehydrogenase [Gemmatimonadaceae bacterium]|jgi:phosphoglycerate dehydrogenase-like enzyme
MPLLVVDGNAVSRTWTMTKAAEQRLRAEAPPGWDVYFVEAQTSSDGDGPRGSSEEVMREIPKADVYLGFGIPRPLYLAAKRLRWVHSAAAGVGNALYPEMLDGDVVLTNSAGVHAIPIAEYIVAGVLYFFRGLDIAVKQQRHGEWDKAPFVGEQSPLREIGHACVLVVGTGGIGSEAARRLTALGANCVGVRRRASLGTPDGFARVIGFEAIDGELQKADVVVLAAPLTEQTRGILNAQRLDMLRPAAVIVNVARGALVDEAALIDHLTDGRIRGAALDVFQEEPLASGSPLWQLRSVLVTPHISPVSPGRFWARELDLFLDNWRRFTRGEPLRNLVDKRAGY